MVYLQVLWDNLRRAELREENGGESETAETSQKGRSHSECSRIKRRPHWWWQDPPAAGTGRGISGRAGEDSGLVQLVDPLVDCCRPLWNFRFSQLKFTLRCRFTPSLKSLPRMHCILVGYSGWLSCHVEFLLTLLCCYHRSRRWVYSQLTSPCSPLWRTSWKRLENLASKTSKVKL